MLMVACILGIVAPPASAQFTLGDYTPTYPFHSNDFDPHVPGPTAYVWPGSGLAAYTGAPAGFPPGYQTPYPNRNPPGNSPSIYQLDSGEYEPFGAILTSTHDHLSTGPLIFALNFTNPCAFGWNDIDNHCGHGLAYMANYTGVTIYVPPEFDLTVAMSNPDMVQSTFGATANGITVTQSGSYDPFGPIEQFPANSLMAGVARGWWIIHVRGDVHWWPQHDYREWYYIRINSVGAPMIAGKYFFKIFLWDEFFNQVWPGMPRSLPVNGYECDPSPVNCLQGQGYFLSVPTSGPTNATVPTENWPVLLVKGEIDPGIITGTIRYGSYNDSLYGRAMSLPVKVRAVGTAIDPYSAGHPTTGRQLEAWGFSNASAQGHYEIEGLAAGFYQVYASAAGYPEQLIGHATILPGEALQVDGYLNPGPVVNGQIFSKHMFGGQSWPAAPRPIYVEIYDSYQYVDQNVVSYSPLNLTDPPYTSYDWEIVSGGGLPTPRPVSFPWDTRDSSAPFSYYSQFFPSPPSSAEFKSHPAILCGGVVDKCAKQNGVGPAEYWWVDGGGIFTNGGGPESFIFHFGVTGIFGAPSEMDGHVPQPFATWVNGLQPGQYWLRAWVNGYVQTLQDGVTFEDYSFQVPNNFWGGDIFVPMDLTPGVVIKETVHFHDRPGTLQECPINGCKGNHAEDLSRGKRFLIAEVRDSLGDLLGINFTSVAGNRSNASIEINGFGMIGPDDFGVKYSYLVYSSLHAVYYPYRDYGLASENYTVYLYMRGYIQREPQNVTVGMGGTVFLSDHLYRGGRLNITAYSLDWEVPSVSRVWEFPGARIRFYVFNSLNVGFGVISGERNYTGGTALSALRQPACVGGICSNSVSPGDSVGTTLRIDEWDGLDSADTYGPDLVTAAISTIGGNLLPYWDDGGFLFAPSTYRFDSDRGFSALDALPADTYSLFAFTYGYVQHQVSTAYVPLGGFADLRLNLLEGVNITLNVLFEKEGVITPTTSNMTMRVRVFDDEGNLVATTSSKSPDNACDNVATFACKGGLGFGLGRFTGSTRDPLRSTGETYYVDPFAHSPSKSNGLTSIDGGPATADTFLWHGTWPIGVGDSLITGWQAFDSNPNFDGVSAFGTIQLNRGSGLFRWITWIPYDTDQVRITLSGIYDPFGDPLDAFNAAVKHTRSWDALTQTGERVDSMFYGIDGFSQNRGYPGAWTVEVDTWNEYPTPTFPKNQAPPESNWYPPVEGLLEGDSYNTVPGSVAGLFGFTGKGLYLGGAPSSNGLGPYSQKSTWTILPAPLGSEVSAVFALDKRGYISGNIYGFTPHDELRTESWVTVEAIPNNGSLAFTQWSWDGHFEMYLDPGQYTLRAITWTTANQGYGTVMFSVFVSGGETSNTIVLYLQESNMPLPELGNNLSMVILLPLAESLSLSRAHRRRRKRAR